MKLVLFAVVILAGTTGFLLWRAGGVPGVHLPLLSSHHEAAAPLPALTPAAKPGAQKVVHARPAAAEDVPVEQIQSATSRTEEPTAPIAARPPIRHPFPSADQVPAGEGEESITGKYGKPSAWVVSSDDGHVVETLVYTREPGNSSTVIRCVDGIVAAAYTKALPQSP